LLQLTLEKEHEVLVAYNGDDALQVAREYHPDFVVLDVVMPGLDGYRVLHRLKSTPETSQMTVIMLTVRDQHDDVMLGFTVGADYYVPKPFNTADIAALIRRHIAGEEKEEASNVKRRTSMGEDPDA